MRVTPRAASDRIGSYVKGVLQVRVTRPPTDGEANVAVRRLLARAAGVPAGRVRLLAGERSRRKRFEVEGIDPDELRRRLEASAGD